MKMKDYLKNIEDNNVSYWLYVRENLKPNDYVKLNIGEITRSINVSPIKGNRIYYANGDDCWFDISAVRNFSSDIIDLIEVGDYVNGRKVYQVGYNFQDDLVLKMSIDKNGNPDNYEDFIYEYEIKSIVTKEMYSSVEYRVETN